MLKVKVKCLINKNANVIPLVLPKLLNKEMSDENFVVLDLEATGGIMGYDLSLGSEYLVYGILEYDKEIKFLIQDDSNIPIFYSSKLFQIIDSNADLEWGTKTILVNDKELLINSYDDLLNYNNLIDLILKKPQAIKNFLAYKESLV